MATWAHCPRQSVQKKEVTMSFPRGSAQRNCPHQLNSSRHRSSSTSKCFQNILFFHFTCRRKKLLKWPLGGKKKEGEAEVGNIFTLVGLPQPLSTPLTASRSFRGNSELTTQKGPVDFFYKCLFIFIRIWNGLKTFRNYYFI